MPPSPTAPTPGAPPQPATTDDSGMPPVPPALFLPVGTTPEEVAALVAVLLAASGGSDGGPQTNRSRWADRTRGIRAELAHGRGAWRASALPR